MLEQIGTNETRREKNQVITYKDKTTSFIHHQTHHYIFS